MSKNSFSVVGDRIYISRPEWDFVAQASIKEEYLEEIQEVTWGLTNGRYPNNAKLGTLHSYIMRKWYGDELCNAMKEKGYVIDHMDNNSSNSCINNLWFLKNNCNKAKGLTFDQENEDKSFIALSVYKDFETKLFQITIMFNYPATLKIEGLEEASVIRLAYLLYDGDYRDVLLDAESILHKYKKGFIFEPEKLNMIDYHIEGEVGVAVPPEVYEEYIKGEHGHAVCFFNKRAPLCGWTENTKEEYFLINDYSNKQYIQVKLWER